MNIQKFLPVAASVGKVGAAPLSVLMAVIGLMIATIAAAHGQGSWQSAQCVPADPTPDLLFDVVVPVEGFENYSGGWAAVEGGQMAKATVKQDMAEHHSGSSSLRVDYDFAGKKDYEYLLIHGPVDFPKAGGAFGFWLKHDGTPFPIRLRVIDVSGECHQIDLLCSTTPGWQFVAGSLNSPSVAWGGDGNKRMDYPCKLDGILIDRPQEGFAGRGSLWIDDVALLRAAKPSVNSLQVEASGRRLGNVYAVGDTVSLRAKGEGDLIRWSLSNYFGKELEHGEGAASSIAMSAALKSPGWFVFKIELVGAGRVLETRLFPCAALPGGKERARSDFFGVCTHFGHNGYPLETMELLQRYGIDQFRDEISWGAYEVQKDHLAMPDFGAAFLERSHELHMRPLLILDYANQNYDQGGYPNSPQAIAAFGRYAVELVRQTRGLVDMFEVWNEWVGGCGMDGRPGKHDGEAYGNLLGPTYKTIKGSYPETKVVGIGGEYGTHCSENILGAIRTAGTNSMDAWSIHPYRYPHSPEMSDLVGEVTRIQEKVAGTGEKSPPWVTEIGYPTHLGNAGCDEFTQARQVVRTLVLLQSMGTVEKTFWYDFKDDGLNREYNENNFGLIHHETYNFAPKPAIVAVNAFIRQTQGAKFKQLARPESLYVAKYRNQQGLDLVLAWSVYGRRAVQITGEVTAAYDLMGAALRVSPPRAELSDTPIYLVGRNLEIAPEH
jgi:hypothetical protein